MSMEIVFSILVNFILMTSWLIHAVEILYFSEKGT